MIQPLEPEARLPGVRAVMLLWLVAAAVLVGVLWSSIPRFGASDPDDYMRLAQVRDLLAGQSWFDVHQYRMAPPQGADMHWSRLVDLPIASFLLFFRLFLPEALATGLAMTAVPLLQLLLIMLLMRRLLLTLGESEGTALTAAGIVVLFPILIGQFTPLRIDHHGWQGICALASALMLARGNDGRAPFYAGLIGAAWLTISLEGLPLVGVVAGVFALRYVLRRENAILAYLAALGLGSLVLFAATRPLAQLWQPVCDAISLPHLAGFAGGAAVMALAPHLPRQNLLVMRVLALGLAGATALALVVFPLGACAVNPFGTLDPVIQRDWLQYVTEGRPFTAQPPSTAVMLVWTLLLVVAGWLLVARSRCGDPRRWNEIGLYALLTAVLSLLIMRAAVSSQFLAVPLVAVLIARLLPRIRAIRSDLPRVLGTVAFLLGITPTAALIAGTLVEQRMQPKAEKQDVRSRAAAQESRCDIAALNALPRSHLFALMDMGPEILARTPHSVVMGPYHRNAPKIRDILEAFGGDPARAEALVRANQPRYLVFCAKLGEAEIAAGRNPANLAAQLTAGKVPGWLEQVSAFKGGIRVYTVKR
jgi:hypothetical protein